MTHLRTPQLPSYDEVNALPTLVEGTVRREFIDQNGHMNIRHHLDLCATGADVICREAGVDDDYRTERSLGLFTAEHHIRYVGEMHAGQALSVHARFLARGSSSGHLTSFLVNQDLRALACVVEIAVVHVDLRTRRPTPFPRDVATRLDVAVEASRVLSWPAPVCGSMGVRPSSPPEDGLDNDR